MGLLLSQLYFPEHVDSHTMPRLVHTAFKIQVFLPFGYPVRAMLRSPHLKYLENKFYPEKPKGNLVSLKQWAFFHLFILIMFCWQSSCNPPHHKATALEQNVFSTVPTFHMVLFQHISVATMSLISAKCTSWAISSFPNSLFQNSSPNSAWLCGRLIAILRLFIL